MAEWRDRGYVPDSDEDEDLEEPRSQILSHKNPADKDILYHNIDDIAANGPHTTILEDGKVLLAVPHESGGVIVVPTSVGDDGGVGEEEIEEVLLVEPSQDSNATNLGVGSSPSRNIQHDSQAEAQLNAESYNEPTVPGGDLLPPEDGLNDSSSLSLLSSPPPATGPLGEEHHETVFSTGHNPSALLGVVITNPVNNLEPEEGTSWGGATVPRTARSLRQRKAIQLHPYALESELYRQSLHARGLKPLRIVQAEAEAAAAANADSQEREFDLDKDSQSQTQTSQPSSPVRAGSVTGILDDDLAADLPSGVDQEDFPDVDVLLHRRPSQGVQRGYKRQKTSHTYGLTGRRTKQYAEGSSNRGKNQPTSTEHSPPHNRDKDSGTAIFDVPLSPPASESSSHPRRSQARSPLFRFPRGQSPKKPETPILTSDPPQTNISSKEQISVDSGSDDNRSVGSEDRSRESSVSPSERTEYVDASHIRRVQRKIRGVLPASWLRLDQQTKPKDFGRRVMSKSTTTSPNKLETGRGVARRVSISRSKVHRTLADLEGPIEVSDASETSEDDLATPKDALSKSPPDRKQTRDRQGRSTLGTGDIWEDNRIDAMLPSTSRNRTGTSDLNRRDKKGQSWQPQHTLLRRSHSSHSHQPKITDHLGGIQISRSAKPKPKLSGLLAPKLSVLDATQSSTGPQSTVPLFIKLAIRQVRRRRDKGRHSPSQKYIKLHHRLDTNDTESVLRDWREGTIAPIQDDSSPALDVERQRAPLVDRSSNEQQNSVSSLVQRNNSCLASHATKRNRVKSMKLKPRQTTLKLAMQRSHNRAFTSNIARPPDHATPVLSRPTESRYIDRNQAPLRPAQMESLEVDFNRQYPRDAFRKGLSKMDLLFRDKLRRAPLDANVPLARFLSNGGEVAVAPEAPPDARLKERRGPGASFYQDPPRKAQRKGRKGCPKRIDADVFDYRQPAEPVLLDAVEDTRSVSNENSSSVLRGLGPFGTRYTVNFDITQLQPGTFFHESTFIGSGDFAKSMFTATAGKIDSHVGHATVMFQGKALQWGLWNDRVSSELGIVLDWIGCETEGSLSQQQADVTIQTRSISKSLIRYFATNLHFAGSYQRGSCLSRCIGLLQSLLDRPTRHTAESVGATRQSQPPVYLLTAIFCAVWANQLRRIAVEDDASRTYEAKIRSLLETALERIVSTLPTESMANIRTFLEENRYHAKREAGIRDGHVDVESVVIVMQIMEQANISKLKLLSVVRRRVSNIERLTDARDLEGLWLDMFTLLPLQEFDAFGILAPGCRFRTPFEDWSVIQDIVTRVFTIYSANTKSQLPSFNEYCRTVLSRCHHLITYWGWRKCETIIGTIFDFFARNHLAHLRNEESHGSPRFLEDLDRIDSLEIEPEDRCFHILLKVIGTGFKAMRRVYPDKRIRDIAWRLMPNHGRSYPKEESVRREDLESLRNHHDLLCTLYWASPPSSRPRASVIRNLVYAETAHREACHINIRAWYNLIKFQLSTQEPASSLQPFADWHGELTRQILLQHNLARTEAQSHFVASVGSKGKTIPLGLLEATISTNQRQVEGILSDLLVSLKKAMALTQCPVNAKVMLGKASVADVLDLFDPQTPRTDVVIGQALHVVLEFVHLCKGDQLIQHTQQASEDSQDYGPWPSDEDIVVAETSLEPGNQQPAAVKAPSRDSTFEAVKHLHNTVFDALARLVSNAFGSDTSPSNEILILITDTWCAVAQLLVKHNFKHWSNFLASYSRESWDSLRSTQQTRIFSTYFLSRIIEMDPRSYRDHPFIFITKWVTCLINPETVRDDADDTDGMQDFSHELTNRLLNEDRDNPLFANLPFRFEPSTGEYRITQEEFEQSRIPLISSILVNMRGALNHMEIASMNDGRKLRQEYNQLLKRLMLVMKKNVQEMQPDAKNRHKYIKIIQDVVGLLQEYTSDICPVDSFFTDSEEFPLPTNDPSYVVGRLKNYGYRTASPGVLKQLAVYIRIRCESAAQNDQQFQLSHQLRQSMYSGYETGNPKNPTMRWVFVMGIFPAYLKVSLRNPESGWILAKPILDATRGMFKDLGQALNPLDLSSIGSVVDIIMTIFESLYWTLNSVFKTAEGREKDPKDFLNTRIAFQTYNVIFFTIASALPVLDFLKSRGWPLQPALRFIESFKVTGTLMVTRAPDDHIHKASYSLPCPAPRFPEARFVDLQTFCSQELHQTLTRKGWIRKENYWMNHQSRVKRYMEGPVRALQGGGSNLHWGFREFFKTLSNMPSLQVNARGVLGQARRNGLGG